MTTIIPHTIKNQEETENLLLRYKELGVGNYIETGIVYWETNSVEGLKKSWNIFNLKGYVSIPISWIVSVIEKDKEY